MATDEQPDAEQDIANALREMVQTRGWQLFKAQARAEWGDAGYAREMRAALSDVPVGPERAYRLAEVAERVEATARAVERIMAWPDERIRALSEKPKRDRFAALRHLTR